MKNRALAQLTQIITVHVDHGKPFNRVTEDVWEAKQGFLPEAQQTLLIRGVFGSRDRATFPIVFSWQAR